MRSSTRDYLRAPGDGVLDMSGHSLDCVRVDERADLRVLLARVAHFQRTRALGKLVRELIGDRAVDHDPLGRHTDLPLVHECAKVRRRHRPFEIGVGQDNQRRFATQLEQDPL
jgi:hypothetical protein